MTGEYLEWLDEERTRMKKKEFDRMKIRRDAKGTEGEEKEGVN